MYSVVTQYYTDSDKALVASLKDKKNLPKLRDDDLYTLPLLTSLYKIILHDLTYTILKFCLSLFNRSPLSNYKIKNEKATKSLK